MSRIMNLKQRVAAVNIIKKTSHALQLTSFAWVSRLKGTLSTMQQIKEAMSSNKTELVRKGALICSKKTLESFFSIESDTMTGTSEKSLIIVLGAQRGFCGNFNPLLQQAMRKIQLKYAAAEWLAIGPYATSFIEEQGWKSAQTYDNSQLAQQAHNRHDYHKWMLLADDIQKSLPIWSKKYSACIVVYLSAKNVLVYESKALSITLPNAEDSLIAQSYKHFENKISLTSALLESWYTEQAARGTAMQQAHTNANNMLQSLSLEYNKLRQARITNELLELTSGHQ